MTRTAWLLLACAACGAGGKSGGPPLDVRLQLFPDEPSDRPARPIAPVAYIDGVATQRADFHYDDGDAAFAVSHVAELRFGATVVASIDLTLVPHGCLDPVNDPGVTSYTASICLYESGDLRFGSAESRGDTVCVGDGFCTPACAPGGPSDGCGAGTHCTARASSMTPFASHLGCAPLGGKQLGDPCAFTADPAGAYDDCAAGLVCVDGACRATCAASPTCATCAYVDGYPPELRACL